MTLLLAVVSALSWLYLLTMRGGFWLCAARDDRDLPPEPSQWPSVVAVVPARNEAEVVGQAVRSLRSQDYPGAFCVVVVDDNSDDGTAEAARGAGGTHSMEIIAGAPLARGWTGKLWAQSQGVAHAGDADYLLLTDADIFHEKGNLRRLVARAEANGLVLTSLMARLAVRSGWERVLIPAFVYFFQMLFPFTWANDPRRKTAAAAGGCMLVRREALEATGGLAAISGEIIDDCALARRMKVQGPIWLG
ncbi:MAG TPA: glycosyltransferase, partial [Caulobacteraceae bacterium]